MAGKYTHIQQHEKEILELKKQGLTHQKIVEKLGGCTKTQIKKFVERYNKKRRVFASGKPIRVKGRPCEKKEIFRHP